MSATIANGCGFVAWILRIGATLAFNRLLLLELDVAGVVSISLWALIAAQGPEAFAKCPFKKTKSLPHPGIWTSVLMGLGCAELLMMVEIGFRFESSF